MNLSFLANASYVKNEIKNLGNQTGYIDKESLPTLGTVSRNQNGYPIGYFFGYKAIGVFQTQEEIDNYISPLPVSLYNRMRYPVIRNLRI